MHIFQTSLGQLNIIYEGESKVRESKIQAYRGQFESIKMKEEENVGEYLLRVDEVVNAIIGLWGQLKGKEVSRKGTKYITNEI